MERKKNGRARKEEENKMKKERKAEGKEAWKAVEFGT
jgi:hypothetical protein